MKPFDRIGRRDQKGIAMVWLALFMLPLILMFAGLAVDISYMYYVKNELQVAADSAALAGAQVLDYTKDDSASAYVQLDARKEAWRFACKNRAAGTPVYVSTNSSTNCDSPPTDPASLNGASNDDNGDIVVGNWNTGTLVFTRATGSTGLEINAMRIRPRRTGDTAGMPQVNIFFGPIFRLLGTSGAGWTAMSATASAIATYSKPYVGPFPVCLPTCSSKTPVYTDWDYDDGQPNLAGVNPIYCTDPGLPTGNGGVSTTETETAPPGQLFQLNSSPQNVFVPKPGMAWTNFKTNECAVSPSCDMPSKNEVLPYLLGKQPDDICNKNICTTNGNISPLLQVLKDQFDMHKTTYSIMGRSVVGWEIYVPIVSDTSCGTPNGSCPGAQNGAANPYYVNNFARVLLTEVVTTGKHGMRLLGLNNAGGTLYNEWTTSPGWSSLGFTCKEQGNNINEKTMYRRVTYIGCVSCDPDSLMPLSGTKPHLVR